MSQYSTDITEIKTGLTEPPADRTTIKLRKWAREWAAQQPVSHIRAFLAELHKKLEESAVEAGITEFNVMDFDLNELLRYLRGIRSQERRSFQQQYGKRDGNLIFCLLWEMLLAILVRLKELAEIPVTSWEFSEAPVNNREINAILEWLFRRV